MTPLDDWRAHVIPLRGATVELPFACWFSADDMARVRAGMPPVDTDERWFAVCLEDGLALCRAHGGYQIYRLPLRPAAGGYLAGPLVVCDDASIHRRLGDGHDFETVKRLLERWLDRPVAISSPACRP